MWYEMARFADRTYTRSAQIQSATLSPHETPLKRGGKSSMRKLTAAIVSLLAALSFSPAAMAQAGNALGNTLYNQLEAKDPSSGGPAPKRDLSGAWAGPLNATTSEELPPMTPLGEKLFSLNKPERQYGTANSNDPLNTCDPLGMPRDLVFETRGLAFSTMPGKIVLLHQYQKIWRDVWMDGRELPKNFDTKGGPASRWYGYSVGHWDGDYTLVIDTSGSNDESWLDTSGHPHSVDARVEERYTRLDHNHMEVVVTVNDPKLYTKPFVLAKAKFRWIPNQETQEQMCIPSEAITYFNTIAAPSFGESTKAK